VNAAALYQPMFGSPSPMLYPSLAMLQPTMLPAPLAPIATQGAADRGSSAPIKNSEILEQYKNLKVHFYFVKNELELTGQLICVADVQQQSQIWTSIAENYTK
jgi:hypothetical protein